MAVVLDTTQPSRAPAPIKISFINSVFHRHDAVSNVMRDQIRALTGCGAYDVRVFAFDASVDDPRLIIVQTPLEALRSPHFRRSQLLIFHYAVYNELLDLIFAALPGQRTLAYFHNVTPSALFDENPRKTSLAIQSERQVDTLFMADFVLCNSDFTLRDLLKRGMARSRLATLSPAAGLVARATPERPAAGPARLLYVGRFVAQKGVRELLHAAAAARRQGASFRLRLVGALRYSDEAYIDELRSIIRDDALSDIVSFAGELSDGALTAEYARAHALVIPSFHEGFCVPVVEALSAGCFVIATDAGNLPELVGKFGAIVPAGDIAALGAALGAFCESVDRGHFPTARFVEEAVRFAAGFSYDEFGAQFRAHVARLLTNTAPSETGDDEPIGVSPAAARLAALEKSFERRRLFSAAARNSIASSEIAPHRLGVLLRTREGPRHVRDE